MCEREICVCEREREREEQQQKQQQQQQQRRAAARPCAAAAPSAAAARLPAPSSPRTKAVIYHELPLQSAQDCLALVAQWASVRIGAVMSPVRIPLVASFAERRGARA